MRISRIEIIRLLVVITTILFCSSIAIAGSAGSTGAAFLELGIGARAAGRGYADAAWADDLYGIYFNPAGIATLKRQEIGFTHNTMFLDLDYNYLGYLHPFEENGAFALNILYVDLGTVERREIANGGGPTAVLGSANGWDVAFSGTYARTLTDFLDFGFTLKLINENLDNYSASAFAVDLGAKWRPPVQGFTVGVSLSNLGTRLKFVSGRDELPLTFRAGLGYKNETGRWGIAGDLVYTKNQELDGAVGGEFWFWPEHLVVRAGANSLSDAANGFTIGAGFRWTDLMLDYAFVPFGDLGDQNLISLSYQFGKARERKVREYKERQRREPSAVSTGEQPPTVSVSPTTMIRYGVAASNIIYQGGREEYEWLAGATRDVLNADWQKQNVKSSVETARFKVDGICWVSDQKFFVSIAMRDENSGQVMMFNSSGDPENPFEIWIDLQRKLNFYLMSNGLSVTLPAIPVRRTVPAVERGAIREDDRSQSSFRSAEDLSTAAASTSSTEFTAEPTVAPVHSTMPVSTQSFRREDAGVISNSVMIARIIEHSTSNTTQLSSRLQSVMEKVLSEAGRLASAEKASNRFEASYSLLEDGTVVLYGRIIDRATGIPLGTIEVYGSSRNVQSLGERAADAVLMKLR